MRTTGQYTLGPVIGSYQGFNIYKWIETAPEDRFIYDGIVDLDNLANLDLFEEDIIFHPGILYRYLPKPPWNVQL